MTRLDKGPLLACPGGSIRVRWETLRVRLCENLLPSCWKGLWNPWKGLWNPWAGRSETLLIYLQDEADDTITESVSNLFQSNANTSYYSPADSYTLGKSETGKILYLIILLFTKVEVTSGGYLPSHFVAFTNTEVNNCFSIYENNYSPQCRWLALDIYLAASRLDKYPPLATSTSVNSC